MPYLWRMKITFDSLIPNTFNFQAILLNAGKLKYSVVLVIPFLTGLAFFAHGIFTLLPALFFFVVVPLAELFLNADHTNFNEKEKAIRANDAFFDWFLYLLIPALFAVLVLFLLTISNPNLAADDFLGRIISMGVLCAVGINLGHELGHRTNRFEQLLGELALLISLENHFLPYHNAGHHRNAATPKDPATARRNELVYTFWFRSQWSSYLQAWQFEFDKQQRNNRKRFSLHNRMVCYTIAQMSLLVMIFFGFGWQTMLAFTAAAIIGKLILETANYIEHYGLTRKMNADGKYERVMPEHSWNSDHILGRSIMLELSRHSDHHYKASKHYQLLDSFQESPQMPTGYPGMMIFSLFSPIWFKYMNKLVDGNKEKALAGRTAEKAK